MTSQSQTVSVPSQSSLPGASKLLSGAFSFYKKNLGVIVGISAVPFIFSIIQIFASSILPSLLIVVLALAAFVLSFLSLLALFSKVVDGGQSVGSAYQKSLEMFFPFIWVSILASLAIFGGFFLLVIPGIIISVLLSLPIYVLFAENRRGTSALVSSWYYVQGYWGSVFLRGLFLFIVIFLISLVITALTAGPATFSALKSGMEPHVSEKSVANLVNLIFDNFFVFPISIIYSYGIYQSLRGIKTSIPSESDQQKIKSNLTIFSIIGAVGIIIMIVFSGFFVVRFFKQMPSVWLKTPPQTSPY